MQAKLDAEVAGIILLRSTADDKVFVLQTERFEQVRWPAWGHLDSPDRRAAAACPAIS